MKHGYRSPPNSTLLIITLLGWSQLIKSSIGFLYLTTSILQLVVDSLCSKLRFQDYSVARTVFFNLTEHLLLYWVRWVTPMRRLNDSFLECLEKSFSKMLSSDITMRTSPGSVFLFLFSSRYWGLCFKILCPVPQRIAIILCNNKNVLLSKLNYHGPLIWYIFSAIWSVWSIMWLWKSELTMTQLC